MFKRIFNGFVLLACVAGLLFGTASPVAAAGTIYVNVNAAGSNNGSSWANAYTSLQTALVAASSGDQIWVAAGTYKPTTNSDRTISFHLKTGVAVYGGFVGTESSLAERDFATNVTILSGDIGTTGDSSDNSYHVVNGSSTISSALLDGFTITAGNANGVNPSDSGGGLYIITGASPTLVNLVFSANQASARGGGMFNHISSAPSLTNVTFSGNSAGKGGGMYNTSASPTLADVTFNGNTSSDMGGGMYNTDGGTPTLTNVTFNGNSATNAGGGMRNIISDPSLTNVTFTGNSAAFGGGMQNLGSFPSLTNVTFSGNTAGGAIYNSSSDPTIRNSILYGNTGGEIVNNSSTPVVTYSIVQGGYAGTGNLDADPLLGALTNNGGLTQTMALGAGSPAINKGDNVTCATTDQRGITRPQGANCDIGAFEVEMLSLSLPSIGVNDGWTLESTETSGVGGTMNNTATQLYIGDNATNRQYRSILSFDTSAMPNNAVVTKVTLKFKHIGFTGTSPFTTHGNLVVDVRKGVFSNNAILQLNDFKAAASKNNALAYSSALVNNWYSKSFNAANFQYINLLGVTQFRLRFAKDDNNDNGADFLKIYSGNAGAANRPQLVIEYYVP